MPTVLVLAVAGAGEQAKPGISAAPAAATAACLIKVLLEFII
jgi:hypothetical protein